jgi:hypothetical protein
MAGKRNEGNGHALFASLTTDENTVLRAKLDAGRASALHVHEDYDFAREAHEVGQDLSEAWRLRWNAENPDYPIG